MTRSHEPFRPSRGVRTWILVTCYLLVGQFVLGMVANLYVQVPAAHPGANAGDYVSGAVEGVRWAALQAPPWLLAHAVLGLALAVNAVALVVAAARSGEAGLLWTVALGGLLVIGAGFNGASFLNYGHDLSSLIMSGLFGLGLATYVTGLFIGAGRR